MKTWGKSTLSTWIRFQGVSAQSDSRFIPNVFKPSKNLEKVFCRGTIPIAQGIVTTLKLESDSVISSKKGSRDTLDTYLF